MLFHCPAKLNLYLKVGPANRPGSANAGYHDIASWMVLTSLHDDLQLVPKFTPGVSLDVATEGLASGQVQIPTDERNLVLKAARALSEHLPDAARESLPGVALHLTKRIPAGAGVGGGSSDAATAIVALNRYWQLGLPVEVLSDVAAKVGSDVPFFLTCMATSIFSAWCTGRGEHVQPIAQPRPKFALLVFPPVHCGTPDVYKQFDEMGLGSDLKQAGRPALGLPAVPLLGQLQNDLQQAAFVKYPRLGEIHEIVERELESAKTKQRVMLTGSGSTLFSLFDQQADAMVAQGRIPIDLPSMVVTLGAIKQAALS